MARTAALYLFVSLLAVSTAAFAQDVLVMKNGDRITGEVKRIWDNEIFIEPEYADEFAVDVPAVAYLDTQNEFEVDFGTGKDIEVRFDGVDEEGNQIIIIGDETKVVPLTAVIELAEIDDPSEWELRVDFNSVINKGNTDNANNALTAEYMFRIGDHLQLLEAYFNREEQDQITTKEQNLFRYTYNWEFRRNWGFGLVASYERDPIRDLDKRLTVGPSLAYTVWDDARRRLNFQFPIGYQSETLAGVDEDNVVMGWIMRFRWKLRKPDVELYHNNSLGTNVAGRTNTSIKTITGFRFEITDLLYANFELVFDWESEPALDAEPDDLTMLIGLGLEFE